MNDIAVIHLGGKRGGLAIIDANHFPWLNTGKWSLDSCGYPRANIMIGGKQRQVRMHTIVHKAPQGMDVDHKNGFRFDCRSCNLRTATPHQTSANVGIQNRPKTSRFKGVCFHKRHKKWQARIECHAKRYNLGTFDCEIEAAKAYNAAAIEHFGEFARLNQFGASGGLSLRGAPRTLPI